MRKVFHRRHKSSGDGGSSKPASITSSTSELSDSTSGSLQTAAGPFSVGVSTDCNQRYRKTMEDAHSFILNYCNSPESGYFGVFDGHAGHLCSQICASKLGGMIASEIEKKEPVPQALHNAFINMDEHLESQNIKNAGSTVAVAVVRVEPGDEGRKGEARRLYVANVGDSRVVLSRAGKALRMSYDHRASDANECRRIHNAGGIVMNSRVNGVLAVTRSLGDLYMKDYVLGDPYTTETVLGKDDEFIILACDGLWDVMSDQEAVELVHQIKDPQKAAKALVSDALDKFSTDNLTVMVIRLDCQAPPAEVAEAGL